VLPWVFLAAVCGVALPAVVSAAVITRGPYLQMPGPDRMLIVYHTDVAIVNAVQFGTTLAPGNIKYGTSVAATGGGFKQTVELTGLTPNTKLLFRIRRDRRDP